MRAWINLSPPYLLRWISPQHLTASTTQQWSEDSSTRLASLAMDLTLYLSNRSFYVHWGNTSSSKLHVNTGVPQGSSLGRLCFSSHVLRCRVLSSLNSFGVRHHQYADNTHFTFRHPSQMCQWKWMFSNNAQSLSITGCWAMAYDSIRRSPT